MNKIYKVIYNKAKGCYTVVSEIAKGHTKWGRSRKVVSSMLSALIVLSLSTGSVYAAANAKFNIQGDAVANGATPTGEIELGTTTPPTLKIVSANKTVLTTAATADGDTITITITPNVAETDATKFATGDNLNKLATAEGVKNYLTSNLNTINSAIASNKIKYFSVFSNDNNWWIKDYWQVNDTNANNEGAKGTLSVAIGRATEVKSIGSVFVGSINTQDAVANAAQNNLMGMFATVLGTKNALHSIDNSKADYFQIAVGSQNNVTGSGAIVIGNSSQAFGTGTIAIGSNLEVNAGNSTAGISGSSIGIVASQQTEAANENPTAVRESSHILGQGNVGIGSAVNIGSNEGGSTNKPYKSVAIGYTTTIKNYTLNAVAIGPYTTVQVSDGVALGSNATVDTSQVKTTSGYDISTNNWATDTTSTWKNNNGIVSFGTNDKKGEKTRRLTRVSAGVDDTDVVNVAQLKKVTLKVKDDAQNPNTMALNLATGTLTTKSDTDQNIKVTVDSANKEIKFGLKPELKGITSITNTAAGNTSTAGTTVTIADAGLSLNNKPITGLVDKFDYNTAATTVQALTNVKNNLTSALKDGTGMAYVNKDGERLVKDGDKFYTADSVKDLVKATDGKYYAAADVNIDGTPKANTNPAANQPVALTGDALNGISLVPIATDGGVATPTSITNLKSGLGLTTMPDTMTTATVQSGDAARKVIAGDNKDGNGGLLALSGKDLYKAATVGDLQAVAAAGLTFTADETNKEINRPLGTSVALKAGNAITDANKTEYSTVNLGTKIDTTNNVITVEMKKALTSVNSIISDDNSDLVLKKGGADKPSVTINDDGLKVTTGTGTTAHNIEIGKDGKISGLTDGAISSNSTEAVTGKQLNSVITNVHNTINNIAGSMVYTNGEGDRLTKVGDKFYKTSDLSDYTLANDGKWYAKDDVDATTGELKNPQANPVDINTKVAADKVVDGNKVFISAVNGDGKTTSAQAISNVASGLNLDNMKVAGADGKQSNAVSTAITSDKARSAIAGGNKDGNGGIYTMSGAQLHTVATIGDLQALGYAGLTFTGNDGSQTKVLGTEIKIKGKADVKNVTNDYTADNLATKIENDATNGTVMTIYMKDRPTFKEVLLDAGDTAKPNDKVSLGVATNALTVTTGDGQTAKTISIGDGKITGLEDGNIADKSKDAVTGGQLFNELAKKADLDGTNLVTTPQGSTTPTSALKEQAQKNWAIALGTGTIGTGDTANGGKETDNNLVTGKTVKAALSDLEIAYTTGTETAKKVKLSDGFKFTAGTGTMGTATTGTDAEKAKAGIVIETKANGEVVIGLDKATLDKIDAVADEVVVEAGDNTTVEKDKPTKEAGKTKYKVSVKEDLTNINSITSKENTNLTLSRKDGSKIVVGENAVELTAGTGADAKTISFGKDGKISGVTSSMTTVADLHNIKDADINTAPNNKLLSSVANLADVKKVIDAGMTFKADGGTSFNPAIGGSVSLLAGKHITDALKPQYETVDSNLGTFVNAANNTINFYMKSTPKFDGITFNAAPNRVLSMNKDGNLIIKNGNKEELLGIHVKGQKGTGYFVPLNGTLEFKNSDTVVSTVEGNIPSANAEKETTPTAQPQPGATTFNAVNTTAVNNPTATQPDATANNAAPATPTGGNGTNSTADSTVIFNVPVNAPIPEGSTITMKEGDNNPKLITNKEYVDNKIAGINSNVVNVANVVNKIGAEIHEVRSESYSGTASALAAASVPQVLNVDRRQLLSVGMGRYRGANAFAIGLSGTNRARDFVYKITGTMDNQNAVGLSVGLGFSIGPKNHYDYKNGEYDPSRINDFNDRITRQQVEIDTLKDFIREMKAEHEATVKKLEAKIEALENK